MRLFEKIFVFRRGRDDGRPLPSAERWFAESSWTLPGVAGEKDELNRTKSRLNDLDVETWHQHSTNHRLSGQVVRYLRQQLDPEMGTVAWAKMFEVLATFVGPRARLDHEHIPQLPARPAAWKDAEAHPVRQRFRTVHLCEAPGAFVAATNHFVKQEYKHPDWDWLACSLNPYYEGNDLGAMIDDDRLVVETLPHWMFGADNTGDIMSSRNIRHMWAAARARFGPPLTDADAVSATMPDGVAQLVSGDGSIDCALEPNNQEQITASLHFCELVCSLGLVQRGGLVCVKMFTLFEHSSVCILYLIHSLFDHLCVIKPATSKEGNSETYAIGVGFRGIERALLDALLAACDNPAALDSKSLFPLSALPHEFVADAAECARRFAHWQTMAIRRNLDIFARSDRWTRAQVNFDRDYVARNWIGIFGPRRIPRLERVSTGSMLSYVRGGSGRGGSVVGDRRKDAGTLEERRENAVRSHMDLEQPLRKRMREDDEALLRINPALRSRLAAAAGAADVDASDAAEASAGGAVEGGGRSGAATESEVPPPAEETDRIAPDAPLADGGAADAAAMTLGSSGRSIGAALMAQMGYAEGEGLGADKQGEVLPLHLDVNAAGVGLGFDRVERDNDAGAAGSELDPYVLVRLSVPEQHRAYLPLGEPPSASDATGPAQRWGDVELVFGRSFPFVRISRVCAYNVLCEMRKQSNAVLERGATPAELRGRAFPNHLLRDAAAGGAGPHAAGDAAVLAGALCFAEVRRHVEHLFATDSGVFLDLGAGGLGVVAGAFEQGERVYRAPAGAAASEWDGPACALLPPEESRPVLLTVGALRDQGGGADAVSSDAEAVQWAASVTDAAAAVGATAPGGAALIRLHGCLTRLSAGLLFCLAHVFEHVALVRSVGLDPASEAVLVWLRDRRPDAHPDVAPVAELLARAAAAAADDGAAAAGRGRLLQLVPASYLQGSRLEGMLRDAVNDVTTARADALRYLVRRADAGRVVDAEDSRLFWHTVRMVLDDDALLARLFPHHPK